MATLVLSRLPFTDSPPLFCDHDGPVIDWLTENFPHGFGCGIRVEINGELIALDDLDRVISGEDVCCISPVPGATAVVGYVINALIAIAVSYVVQKVFAPNAPKAPGSTDQPQPNSIYSVAAAQENAARIGETMPVIYGEVMSTPDLAMQSYYAYTEVFLPAQPTAPAGVTVMRNSLTGITANNTYVMAAYYFWHQWPPNSGSWVLVYGDQQITTEIYYWTEFFGSNVAWNARISPSNADPFAAGSVQLVPKNTVYDFLILAPASTSAPATAIDRAKNQDGDQYLCQLFCVGLGAHEAFTPARVKIGNIYLSDLAPSIYSLLDAPPALHGGQMGAISYAFPAVAGAPSFHENVITAIEVGTQELIDLNDETQFFPAGNQRINRIAVDILFPRGLYKINTSTGNFQNIVVQIDVIVEAWTGAAWLPFAIRPVQFRNQSIKTVSPWRRSLILDVGPGTYRVKLKRQTPQANTDGSVADAVQWIGLRGYAVMQEEGGTPKSAYGNSHLIALRLQASDAVSGAASTRVRARARRLLNVPAAINPVSPGVQFTRNPVAFCHDILCNQEYGGRRAIDELDTATLSKLYTHWAAANGFNGAFNQPGTVFESLTTVLQVVAAAPLAIGGQISARYEGVKPYRMQLFTDANVVEDSLSISYSFDSVGGYDGVRVEFRNPDTWEPEFYLHPTKSAYPEDVNLFGCTDRLAAAQMAIFLYQWRRYQHKSIRFDVELEGNLSRPGERIAVQHQIINMTAGGLVARYTPGSLTLELDRPVDFFPGETHTVLLRNADGTPGESRVVTFGGSRLLQLSAALTLPIRTAIDDNPTVFAFGTVAAVVRDYLMDSATHSGGNVFTIEGTVYDENAYQGAMPYLTTPVP